MHGGQRRILLGFLSWFLLLHGGQRRIFFWLNLTLLLRGLLRSTRHAKKRRTVPRLTVESLAIFALELADSGNFGLN